MVSSIAVVGKEKLLGELNIENTKHHSERLVAYTEKLLEMTEVSKSDLSALAVSNGPGSFTGLRIGMATAKAMAYVLKIPVIGISTLQGLAWNIFSEGALLCPIMDAQKGNVYNALYQVENGTLKELSEIRVEPIEEVLQRAKNNPTTMILGEGNSKMQSLLTEYQMIHQRPPLHLCMPRAASIGYAAMERFVKGDFDSIMDIVPDYIRRSEAEELWEKKQGQ